MPRLALLVPLLLLGFAPLAGAAPARSLSELEEPVVASEEVLDVQVTEEEAGVPRIVIYLNEPGRTFGLAVYRGDGTTAFEKNGTRGVQPFPALDEGLHKFHVRRQGAFQLTDKSLDRLGGRDVVTDANATLHGTDAWVLAPSQSWILHAEGNVTAELRDLGGATRTIPTPLSVPVSRGSAYVLTLRGEEGAPYRVWLEPVGPETPGAPLAGGADPDAQTPGPGALLVGAALAAGTLLRRRRGSPRERPVTPGAP